MGIATPGPFRKHSNVTPGVIIYNIRFGNLEVFDIDGFSLTYSNIVEREEPTKCHYSISVK